MHKAEIRLAAVVQRRPIVADGLQQVEGPDDVRLQERARIGDGPVDVGLGGEIDQLARAVRVQQRRHRRLIGDVAVDERVPRVERQRCQIVQIAGVGQLVQRDDRFVAAGKPVQDEVGPDKAGAAGDDNAHVLGNLKAGEVRRVAATP
ncbi:hypothetical protein G6F65_017491 [Rhizopus arrhizus]|nr:hypothetical protein G6F65_017491 [Rhizopus arrhizus]